MFRKNTNERTHYSVRIITFMMLALSVLVFTIARNAVADEEDLAGRKYPRAKVYQLHKMESGYNYSESDLLKDGEMLPFGRKYAGDFYLTGDNLQEKEHQNEKAYATSGKVVFNYSYNGSLSDRDKKDWQFYDDDQKKVKGFSLNRKVEKGTVIIDKSYDNVVWTNEDYYTNFFDKHKSGMRGIYETKEEDVKQGVYYRVTVAYTVRKYDGFKLDFKDDYDYEECIEVYSFYVGSEGSTLHIRDIFTGTDITNTEINVKNGFTVMSDSAFSTIFVQEPGGYEHSVENYSVYTKKGEYAIKLRSAFGDEYNYKVKINDGVDMQEITPVSYETDNSYESSEAVSNPIGSHTMTSLFVEQENGYRIKKTEYEGVQAISVDGEGVAIYLQLNYGKTLGNGWTLASDSYGGKEGQKICGVTTGKVETGALIIKTSKDGKTWDKLEEEQNTDVLKTSDFQNYYGSGRRIQIYTPNGIEVQYGQYVRVIYAFEIERKDESKNVIEEYTFYLSNSNTDAVVFKNKSVEAELQELLSEEDQITADIYRRAETLTNNALTLNGFSIDISQNPTVKYEVLRNGQVMVGSTTEFTESGKYQITLNAVGESKTVTIYVDRDSAKDSLEKYFGNGFLSGKRIYAETGYPVYVGGQTSYNILEVSDTMLPVSGKIVNLTTGKEISIDATRRAKSGTITEPGEYEAKLYTNKSFRGEEPVGDTKVFTFHFIVIAEKDVPGPVVNERSLKEYVKTNISDLCPRYFGITYPSAGKGYITCIFATYEDAFQYAYEHEKGEVEKLEDGTYRYKGSYQIAQKEKYESTWELTDAITFFAKQAVKEYFFDLSDDYSYITLPQGYYE